MKVNLPLAFPVKIRFIIYRDSLCIFLLSTNSHYKKVYNFRLVPDFWFNPRSQIEFILQFIKLIENDNGFDIILNDKLIPSDLASEIDSYELIVRKDKEIVSDLYSSFDTVSERNFMGVSPYFERFNDDNYLYIDFDVDSLGMFASSNHRKVGGYWSLGYLFYEQLGLGSFLEQSVFDLDTRSSNILFSGIMNQIEVILKKQNLEMSAFSKMYLGGISAEYFNKTTTALLGENQLELIEDQHFELLLNPLN